MNKHIALMQELNPDAYTIDGFDDCITGIVFNQVSYMMLYSEKKIVEQLINSDGMSEEEALEYYEYNILGSNMGESSPMFTEPYELSTGENDDL